MQVGIQEKERNIRYEQRRIQGEIDDEMFYACEGNKLYILTCGKTLFDRGFDVNY